MNREFSCRFDEFYEKQCERNDRNTGEYTVCAPRQRSRAHGALSPHTFLQKKQKLQWFHSHLTAPISIQRQFSCSWHSTLNYKDVSLPQNGKYKKHRYGADLNSSKSHKECWKKRKLRSSRFTEAGGWCLEDNNVQWCELFRLIGPRSSYLPLFPVKAYFVVNNTYTVIRTRW